jgi:hypothetical protein
VNYQPYLIANYETGIDKRLQPWLSPDDSQEELLDGYVYRGTLSKRSGYSYFATGERGGTPYTESRIVTGAVILAPATGAIDGVNATFTFTATPPVRVMSFVITGSNPVQTFTDNGLGFFFNGITQIGTINYSTGAVSITLPAAPVALSTLTALYVSASIPDLPVMMVATYVTATNIKELIVANTRDVNRYNPNTNRLDFLPHTTVFTGTSFNFFSWVNYDSATSVPRLLFSNSIDPIQVYDGATVANYVFTMTGVAVGQLSALLMFEFKDRLILLRTRENGTIFPKRIRISGTGINSDDFRTSATGAGFIDIPDGTWIMGAAFNRDDLIIFTEQATWSLKYTGNDTTPFTLVKLDESRGSKAPYAAISYLSRTSALSPRGMILTDGYRVERQDISIPSFTFDEIDPDNFELCFAGSVDEDRDHYLIYPPPNEAQSQRILTTNYDEDNYAVYRLPLSCMGTYILGFDITWNDLLVYNNWDEFAAVYGNWEAFAFSKGAPFSVGGGHHGEIWKLNVTGSEDNPVKIRNITIIDNTTIEVTTDWHNFSTHVSGTQNYDPALGADIIFLTAVGGMVEVNDQQFTLASVTNNNVFRLRTPESTAIFSAYTTGGTASRVIPFSAQFKKFNPYINADKKVRCGWMYVYVDSTGTNLERPIRIIGASQATAAVITTNVNHGLVTGDQVKIFSVGGMTQLNGLSYYITVLSLNTFSLDDTDSTLFTPYTVGGYASTPEKAKMVLDIITDDMDDTEIPTKSVVGTSTNLIFENGAKKWYKVYINQTGKFIQFRMRSQQAGATINVQATMMGFAPVGRLI